ncbi:DUF1214 domain-containing protein [uncultured Maricaulis sp.]|uniref:DUF1214 domain-containing protein n=1 Tax=uncultured Maricaulis sp. TaxID=174710 RepID=UPI0030D816D1|tara:strand:+ start:98831 stop:99418 length:588 start_codon:yes stop_codon:yes gene_type:complete
MWIKTGLAALAGLACGAALALLLVFGPLEIGGTQAGPWKTNLLIGDPSASAVVRAAIARRGLLALNRSEAIYFNATSDENGERLREECIYQVSFEREPDARWWSLTLYADDDFLAVNGDNAHSITAEHAAASAEDPMTVTIAASQPGTPTYWMSSHNAGRFALTLRLYQPDASISASPASAALPLIERLSCRGEA